MGKNFADKICFLNIFRLLNRHLLSLKVVILVSKIRSMKIFSGQNISYGNSGKRRGFKIFPILLFAAIGIVYYFSNQQVVPVSGRKQFVRMTRDEEATLGIQSFREVLNNAEIIESGKEAELVREVGARIAKVSDDPGFEWEFVLVRSEQINAFCLPGGKVAVYSGILPVAKNVDGLAIVMAHEIAHAIARHGAERMAQQELVQMGQIAVGMAVGEMDYEKQRAIMGVFGAGTQFGVLLPFSRKHESEADFIGLQYAAKACFDPREAPQLWQRMGEASSGNRPLEFMSTHPSDQTRIDQFKVWMDDAIKVRQENCGK